jgi:hypothetical protein
LDCSAGGSPLISPYTKRECDEMWGVIVHPTIGDFVKMIVRFVEEMDVGWDRILLWKVDLRGAYTLLSFHDDDVPVVGALLTEDRVMFFL